MPRKIIVIGSGISSLSAASFLSKEGNDVTIIEKNKQIGGRARKFEIDGFTFDMGPSWYWMPDVFERFFNRFNKKIDDYFKIEKLDPGFQIIKKDLNEMKISSKWNEILKLFEDYEEGSSKSLEKFMDEAKFKYDFGINEFVYKPGDSIFELFKLDIFKNIFKLQIFSSYRNHVNKHFDNVDLKSLMEFPVLFLGTAPKDTPALYSLMAYSGIKCGTFYPEGGFGSVIDGFVKLCKELSVEFLNNTNVKKINTDGGIAKSLETNRGTFKFDTIIASADYNHVEQSLLNKKQRNYSKEYWEKKVFSPSSLLFYLGVNKKIKKIEHHNLFFDEDIENHVNEIYKNPCWPSKPLFYVCCPSKTDKSVAPVGKENLFLLMPIAAGISDSDEMREKYFEIMIKRLESYCGEEIVDHIEYKKSYCVDDFKNDYNAFKGNAYGLANTLTQTANLKPKIRNKKIKNLFYTGQLTVPGPGVPPSIISGQVVADYIIKNNI